MPKMYSRNRMMLKTQIKKDDDISMDKDKLHEKMAELDPDIRFGRAKNIINGGNVSANTKLVPVRHTPLMGGSFFENVMSCGTIQSKRKEKNRNNLKFVI